MLRRYFLGTAKLAGWLMARAVRQPVVLMKWYWVVSWMLDRVDHFPKNQRFVFGQRLAVLTAVENGGAGTVSRRSKMAAHNRAVLCEGTIGATAPITPFSRERHRSAQRHGDLERDTT